MTETRWDAVRPVLLRTIEDHVTDPLPADVFDRLALDVFRLQWECNPLYRRFCKRRGATPGSIDGWKDIPAVPTDAFKAAELTCLDGEQPAAVFRTSGTTSGDHRRGRHILPALDLYDAALSASFAAHLMPEGRCLPMLALIPSPEVAPESSLSHMAGRVMERFGTHTSEFVVDAGGLAAEAACAWLESSASGESPACILATSLSLLHLLDEMAAAGVRVALPPGSRLMDTGGFKGAGREVSRAELTARVADQLGISPPWCVNEYGMTEMSSQFYDGVAGRSHGASADRSYRGPGWVRTLAADPDTLRPLPFGEQGVLRHFDLANLYTVAALQTHDLGICHADGTFSLHGRVPGAEARGCSIAMDEMLSAARSSAGAA